MTKRGGLFPLAARLAVTVGLLGVLVFVVAEPTELLARLRGTRLMPLLAAVALSALDRFVMAYKWSLLLAARGVAVGLWTAVRAYFASSLVGLVLPVTVGADAMRVIALRRVGMLEVTASIVIERLLGVMAMASVALLSCLILANALADLGVESLFVWLLAAVVIGTVAFVGSLLAAERWASHAAGSSSRLRRAAEAYGRYRQHPGVLAVFYALSVFEGLLSAAIAYVAAIGLGVDVPPLILIATVPLAMASARLPISLGGFGVQEAAFVYLAGVVGVGGTDALSIMLVSDIAMLVALAPAVLDTEMFGLRREAATARML